MEADDGDPMSEKARHVATHAISASIMVVTGIVKSQGLTMGR